MNENARVSDRAPQVLSARSREDSGDISPPPVKKPDRVSADERAILTRRRFLVASVLSTAGVALGVGLPTYGEDVDDTLDGDVPDGVDVTDDVTGDDVTGDDIAGDDGSDQPDDMSQGDEETYVPIPECLLEGPQVCLCTCDVREPGPRGSLAPALLALPLAVLAAGRGSKDGR